MPATIGLDIAKRFFQLHTVDPDTGEICKVKLRRTEMISFFANHAADHRNGSLRQFSSLGANVESARS